MYILTMLCILFAATAVWGEPLPPPQNIHKMKANEALSVLASYRQEREDAIRSLQSFFADKDNVAKRPDVLIEVMNVAGSLRVNEVIPDILDNITFQPIKFRDRFISPEDYPAVKALIHIGFPAVQVVLDRAQKEPNESILALYAAVVKGVLGHEFGANCVAVMAKKNKNLKSFQNRYFPTGNASTN